MSVVLRSVTFATPDPSRDARFWGDVLERDAHGERGSDAVILPGADGQLGLRFVAGPDHGDRWNRLHLHLSEGVHDQAAWIERCVESGARLRGNGHVPPGGFAAMADPVGDEFCVIEDGNRYLAACGPLGEVTCEGTRRVGLFWSAVLEWPLVWEEGEETAVQSPIGGTKVSWSGDAPDPDRAHDRQYFLLGVDGAEFDREIERITALGATFVSAEPGGDTVLLDPDGIRFVIRTDSVAPTV